MKKHIVINASKNRSRIAIVEDGQLAELYVEHPGNVRTIGNIVLGHVQKVKPDLKAAFVDIGQKQDAFLHFSDLTDNLAHLLSLVGEDVPGLEEPVLSLAPQKQVADDPDEPDVEEQLEVESDDQKQNQKSSRNRRSRNRRSRRRKNNRKREEEEEEESGDDLPFVIDLTKKTGKISTTEDESGKNRSSEKKSSSGSGSQSRSSKTRSRGSRGSNGQESKAKSKKKSEANDEKGSSRSKRSRRRSRRGSRGSGSRTSQGPSSGKKQPQGGSSSKGQDKKKEKSDRNRKSGGRRSGKDTSKKKKTKKKSGKRSNAKLPPPQELLRDGGNALVKITKEPFASKGSRVSTDISLAGRFLVLVPAAEYVAVSKKINSYKERRRLRNLAQNLKPEGFGVIVRTVANKKKAKTLETDMRLLVEKWRSIETQLREKPKPPVTLYEDVNMISSIMRDLFTSDYDKILVDDPRLFKNLHAYVKAVAPKMADKVQLHRSNKPIFRTVGIERQVKQAFSKRVDLKSGGYIFIETTEAMHVIDVNSGRAGKGKSYQQNLLDVNLEAAEEVARQLRLRDLGGIIVVDFIDLNNEGARRKVARALQTAFKRDRAVTKLLPMSDFGIIQITRQRLRPSITSSAENGTEEPVDPAEAARIAGADEIPQPERSFNTPQDEKTPREFAGELGRWLTYYRDNVGDRYRKRPIVVRVHPLTAGFLRRGFPSPITRWRFKLRGITFHLEEDTSIDPLSYKVEDQKSGRSLLSKYKVSD